MGSVEAVSRIRYQVFTPANYLLKKTKIAIKHQRAIFEFVRGIPSHTVITRMGQSIKDDPGIPHPRGLDELKNKLQYLWDGGKTNILIIANHPDFVRPDLQNSLWYIEIFGTMGEVIGIDPYIFISSEVLPKAAMALSDRLLIVETQKDQKVEESRQSVKSNIDPRHNARILHRVRTKIQSNEKNIFFIFPEGQNAKNDIMIQPRLGVSTIIKMAERYNKPLVILPIALIQNLAFRDKSRSIDQYVVVTGDPVTLSNLPKSTEVATKKRREVTVEYIMSKIAGMLPREKLGYFKSR
jgi:hypothetical protein